MSVTSGFYNSVGDDRLYDAVQMSQLFDGILNDGIFETVGTYFTVKAYENFMLNVGIGRAWFNHTWTYNDAILPITIENAEVLLDRIDAIVIEVNTLESIRENAIKIVKGTPSSNAQKPTLTNANGVYQHALAYVTVLAGVTEIRQADIENAIGTEETPFVTGILKTVSMDELLGQWQDELDRFVADEKSDFDIDYQAMKQALHDAANELSQWTSNEEASFLAWFATVKNQLSTDQAGHLQNEIEKEEVERILMTGLTDGVKNISEDGTVISTTDSTGRTLVKTFTEGFLICTSVLKDSVGGLMGSMVKTFSADGTTISTIITII
ncbi:MAG: hypothetical protein PHS74_00220 [Lachnospiraceae bacterium]|nr:hypothetical protein [Lachnospiraceae bacterium]